MSIERSFFDQNFDFYSEARFLSESSFFAQNLNFKSEARFLILAQNSINFVQNFDFGLIFASIFPKNFGL